MPSSWAVVETNGEWANCSMNFSFAGFCIPHATALNPRRRSFAAAYKVRIVEEVEACREPGEIGALLRREGLYSSHLADWRREYHAGAAERLAKQHRGPKGQSPLARQKEDLEQQVARLQERLRQAELIIGIQKKVSELLGLPLMAEMER